MKEEDKQQTISINTSSQKNGKIEVNRRKLYPTLLDYLFDEGRLGCGEVAHARYSAGLRLREFYYSVFQSAQIASYDLLSHIPATGDMTDQEDQAREKWSCILRELGRHAQATRHICIEDRLPPSTALVKKALDKLIQINL